MNCPKCNIEIMEDMLVCPNCKKVLKLVCPKCKTINKSNTCKQCGFTIITKCHKCGKVNQTINGKCSKCGFSTYTSVAINSSNIDEFACLTIEFPNLNEIKPALGSTKLAEKFKINLDNLILKYVREANLNREIIGNVYVVRLNKDDTFKTSANNAVRAAIDILNLVNELNFKLNKLVNTALECKIAILKRDVNSKPEEYKSGFDIKLINQYSGDSKLLKNLQIIADSYIHEQVCENFELEVLSANFVKNEMIMFFELNLKKYIKLPEAKKEDKAPPALDKLDIFDAQLEKDEDKNDLYDVDAITFDELKSTFKNKRSIDLASEVLKEFEKEQKKVISIKCKKETYPQTDEIIAALENANLFKNILKITCYDDMKYKPYGFFSELISIKYGYTQGAKKLELNNFERFNEIDPSGFIKDLINLNERSFPHPEDIRFSLFDIFFEIFQAMSNTLIYIENFEKIDDTSHEVLQFIFDKFEELDISYLVVANKDFSLHKSSHFLLKNPNYVEITSAVTPFRGIIEQNAQRYSEILDSYYIRKIAEYTKGNVLYFKNAIEYLLEIGLLKIENETLFVEKFENILIPPMFEELISKRLKHLSEEGLDGEAAYKLFLMLLSIGPRIDLQTVKLLQIHNEAKAIKKLKDKKYIFIANNAIYISKFNVYKEIFNSIVPLELKQVIAGEVIHNAFLPFYCNPVVASLHNILEQGKQEFLDWECLSRLNASMGDFSAYLNCSIKFLKLLDNHVNEDSEKNIEEYKMDVYENISNLLYKYTPNEIHNITQVILNNLEKTTNHKKVIDLCNKMLQGCLIGGNYSYALELLHKILSRFSNASLNPLDKNFDISFFLISLVKIEVLFSIGDLKGCIETGDEILKVITKENLSALKPENLSLKQFEGVLFDGMSFAAISRVILLQNEIELASFINEIRNHTGEVPQVFNSFLIMGKLIKGQKIKRVENKQFEVDKFSTIAINFINAFCESTIDYKKFAGYIYPAKISAKMNKLSQIELICDLLIGYSYFKINQPKKAFSIYQSVLDTSTKNGLKLVTYLDWYFISVLKFEEQDIEVAFGIVNNALVQLEKDSNSGDFLFFLFRVLLAKILMVKNDKQSSQICLNNAKFIKEKYGLNFDINLI